MQATLAIEARGLGKRFGPLWALDDVDLALPPGHFLTLFGPNGAGKTTLVRLLSTLARPTSGSIRLFGRDLRAEGSDLRRRIGVVSHSSYLYRSLSAYENLNFYARMFEVEDAGGRARQVLDEVGLADRMHDPVRTFSRGMEQRCAIARALVHSPDLLLLDEPFTGLDPDAADRLAGLLARMHDGTRTVLLTSHDLAHGSDLADRVAILSNGRIVHEGAADDAAAEDIVSTYRRATGA